MIYDDEIVKSIWQNNVTCEIHLETLNASPQDNSAGAPVIGRYVNSHVCQMVRSTPGQYKYTPRKKKKQMLE